MKRQSGATLSGLIFFLILLGLALYTAVRIVPAYMDYWLIGRVLDTLVAQPSLRNSSDENIRTQFAKQLAFNNITLADRSNLLIERTAGGLNLSAAFSVKQPFLGPINLCLEFQAEADSGSQPGH